MTYQPQAPVNIPLGDFMELKFYLTEERPGVTPDGFMSELLHRWLMIETERLTLRRSGPALHGYQWKNLFLPDGLVPLIAGSAVSAVNKAAYEKSKSFLANRNWRPF